MQSPTEEILVTAARLIAEDGLDYGAAKRLAAKQLGLHGRVHYPGNEELEEAVREYIGLFLSDSQPAELLALRELALIWMERLSAFRPHLSGAVWNGTATRHSDVHLQLFCDDPKSAEMALIDHRADYQAGAVIGFNGRETPVLSLRCPCAALNETVAVHLMVHDYDELRGAVRADSRGKTPRGSLEGVRQMVHDAKP